jgi:hypothetical protein
MERLFRVYVVELFYIQEKGAILHLEARDEGRERGMCRRS